VIYFIIALLISPVLRCTVLSALSFEDLSGFWGSYIGGALGGLGTLIAVYLTIRDSHKQQRLNDEKTTNRIYAETKKHNDDRIEDKRFQECQERLHFTDDIAVYIGKYITHISKYYYACMWAEGINKRFDHACQELSDLESKLVRLNNEIDKTGLDSEDFVKLDIRRNHVNDELEIKKRKYASLLSEKEKNSDEGNRTLANECYFILRTKLYNISGADALLEQLSLLHNKMFNHFTAEDFNNDWLGRNNDQLIKEYESFRTKYCGDLKS
jgi:hypothetical protein